MHLPPPHLLPLLHPKCFGACSSIEELNETVGLFDRDLREGTVTMKAVEYVSFRNFLSGKVS